MGIVIVVGTVDNVDISVGAVNAVSVLRVPPGCWA